MGGQAGRQPGAECGWHRTGHSLQNLEKRSAVLRLVWLAGGLIRDPSFNNYGKDNIWVGRGPLLITSVWIFPGTLNLRLTGSGTQSTVYLLPSHFNFNLFKNINLPRMFTCSCVLGPVISSGKLCVICIPPPLHQPRLSVHRERSPVTCWGLSSCLPHSLWSSEGASATPGL